MSAVVYLAGPIKGLSYTDATSWRTVAAFDLRRFGIKTTDPLRGKSYLTNETVLDADYPDHPMSTQRGIMTRDYYDCVNANCILVNFIGAASVSIGACMECAWAYQKQIPVVCVIEKEGNLHDHPMLRETIGYRVDNLVEGINLVRVLLEPYVTKNL